MPGEALGFNGPPEAGDRLAVVENEARARQVTSYRAHQKRENAAASISGMRGSLEQMMSQLKTSGRKEFPRSEEHTSELQSHSDLVCRLLLEKKKKKTSHSYLIR